MSALVAARHGPTPVRPAARPQLTSLVDMMVILVVFLLKSFSVEGQLVTPAEGLELPVTVDAAPVPAGRVVEIGPETIRVDGAHVLATAVATSDTTALAVALARLAAEGAGPVVVQCDRRLDFGVLGHVLRACGRAGLDDLSLLALEDES
ncbi:MAG: hypothetical protein GY838_03195 [bacterium]|nr:hypothetical protein [bacterium]